MKLTLNIPTVRYTIQSYGTGHVIINHQCYKHSLVVMPEQLITDWPPRNVEDLTAAHFVEIAQYPLEVLILGTGDRPLFPPRAIFLPLEEQGIGVDIMNLGAACRTYSLLAAEKRQVAVALLLE